MAPSDHSFTPFPSPLSLACLPGALPRSLPDHSVKPGITHTQKKCKAGRGEHRRGEERGKNALETRLVLTEFKYFKHQVETVKK
ncbi:unnamed protein product [Boreogadus saida]